jgi:2-oxoglutarate ferredoxin oxidoreductase subunit delta
VEVSMTATVGSMQPAIATLGTAEFVPVEIATDRCKGCALCVAACPKGVLALDDTGVNALGHHAVRLVDAAACTSCVLCARVCPDAVLTIYARSRRA